MNVKLYKLISGEEIIGTVESETEQQVGLKDTVTVTYHPTGDGKMSSGFAPHMPHSDGIISLKTSAIAFVADVNSDILNEYKRIFGGIVVPNSGLKIAK